MHRLPPRSGPSHACCLDASQTPRVLSDVGARADETLNTDLGIAENVLLKLLAAMPITWLENSGWQAATRVGFSSSAEEDKLRVAPPSRGRFEARSTAGCALNAWTLIGGEKALAWVGAAFGTPVA
jgi:hypothetical protein